MVVVQEIQKISRNPSPGSCANNLAHLTRQVPVYITMKIINLTPHTINICDDAGTVVKSYPSAGNARVNTEFSDRPAISGIPVKSVIYSETEGLPTAENGVFYLVSMVVAQANPGRADLLCPNTAPGEVVRDAAGNIVGVKSLARY